MKFIPRELITSATIYAYGIKGSAKMPLSINHDACQGPYGLSCPLKAGVQAELVFSVKPKFYIPRGEYGMETYIKDQNGNLVVCGKIDLEIA